jgi:ribokinase
MMKNSSILVSGLINIETTLRVDGFPIDYRPVRFPFFGVDSTVSGVGYNVSKALTTLGNDVRFASLIGRDEAGTRVHHALAEDGIPDGYVLDQLKRTAQSVILYDPDGRRMINTDLKDIQEQVYPPVVFERALHHCSLAVICNINFNRPHLRFAKENGVTIATDVHTIDDLDDEFNQDFMAAADILFMSDESLPCPPEEWARAMQKRYGNAIVAIGLGQEGVLLAVKEEDFLGRFPAASTRPVVNTIGAGDALFSAFVHNYRKTSDPYEAMRKAVVFASYKIGETGAAAGFLDEAGFEQLVGEK